METLLESLHSLQGLKHSLWSEDGGWNFFSNLSCRHLGKHPTSVRAEQGTWTLQNHSHQNVGTFLEGVVLCSSPVGFCVNMKRVKFSRRFWLQRGNSLTQSLALWIYCILQHLWLSKSPIGEKIAPILEKRNLFVSALTSRVRNPNLELTGCV